MLQAIRSKASSFVIKVLFGALIVSFGVWGIGDIFRNRDVDTSVAKVGGRTITAQQLGTAVQQQVEQLRAATNGQFTLEQAKQLGIVDSALQRLIDTDLIDLEIQRLNLAIGDQAVREAIVSNPNFRGANGVFDRNIYARMLAANRMGEPEFESEMRKDLIRRQLAGALTDGMSAPQAAADALYRARAEKRVADVVTLPESAAGTIPAPSDDQLNTYYEANKERFRAPERRSFTLALLRAEDVAASIKVPEDKLRDEYKNRADEFHTPEQRQLQQILFPDEAKAKEAAEQLASGKDFTAVAKDVAGADPTTLDLGWMKREDLPPELADAAFALKQGGVTAPLHSSFGWHILRLEAVKPEETQSFDAVKDKLAQEVARDQAGDQIAKTANDIDDAMAGGASFADVVKKFGLKTTSFADLDAEGHDAEGKDADLPKQRDAVLHTAFGTENGQASQLNELGEDGYYLVQVDKVTPATVKPLADVHDQAVKLWQDEQRQTALRKLADDIAKEVEGGKSLKDVAAQRNLTVATTEPLPRSGASKDAPPALVAKLFDLKPNGATTAESGDSFAVAQLKEIQPADPAKDKAQVDQLARQLGTQMQNDMLEEYGKALNQHFPVEINRANIDRLL